MIRSTILTLLVLAMPVAALFGQAAHTAPAVTLRVVPLEQVSLPREAIETAMKYLGVPYVPGGVSATGLDCSGLVYRVFHDGAGLSMPGGVGALFRTGTAATYPLHIGDLVFFDTESRGSLSVATHVGIYIGNGKFIHAASEGQHTGVIVSPLDSPYYRDRFLGARRVIPWRQPVLRMVLTDTAKEEATANPFPSREPMRIEVLNDMAGGGPMDLTILKDGKPVFATRIAPGVSGPAVIPLTPDTGRWDVEVNRLWKGRELGRLTFTVEE